MSTIYTVNNKVLKNSFNDKWLIKATTIPDPYNPLGLPSNTIRVKIIIGYTPAIGDTQTLVDSTNNVWDIYKESTDWFNLFKDYYNLVEVLGANTSNITYMGGMFYNCISLTSVALFDTTNVTGMGNMFNNCNSLTSVPLYNTSNVTNMNSMFYSCTNLTTIPLFDTTKVTNMNTAFRDCRNVQSGALALYQQASTQATPPSSHTRTFTDCGSNTTTGAAELAQISSEWK